MKNVCDRSYAFARVHACSYRRDDGAERNQEPDRGKVRVCFSNRINIQMRYIVFLIPFRLLVHSGS